MARRTDDHPLEHADAQEAITEGDDGTDNVTVWDQGTYANRTNHAMVKCLGRGHLSFRLDGEKLYGGYALTRVREGDDETWLLVKRHDDQSDTRNHLDGPQ